MSILAKAIVVIGGDTSDLDAKLAKSVTTMERAGENLQRVGMKLSTHLTLPMTLAAGAAVHLAADFDSSMRKIVALTETSAEQVEAWKDDVKELGAQFGKSADEAADALFFITGAGIQGDRAMEALRASLAGAAIGLGETKTVADAATSAMNAYSKTGLTATQATETLAAAIKFGKIEASAVAPVMGRLTGTASALNISFADLAGTLAVFSRTGTDASEGATQINAIMSTLLGTSEEGEKVLAAAGLSLDHLREVASGPRGLINVMRILDERLTLPQLRMVIPNVRAFRGVMNALAQDAATVDKILDGTANSAGFLDQALAASQGPAFRVKQAWAQMKNALIDVGDALIPVVIPAIQSLASAVKDAVSWFTNLDASTRTLVITLGAFAAALGPALLLIGSLIKAVAALKLAAASLGLGLGGMSMLFAAGGALLVGITAVTAAWIDMKVEVGRTEAAIVESTRKMDEAISRFSRKQTTAAINRLSPMVTDLEDQIAIIDAKLKLLAKPMLDPTVPRQGVVQDPNEARSERLREEREELKENLDQYSRQLTKLRELARAQDEAANVGKKANDENRRTKTVSVEITNAVTELASALSGIVALEQVLGTEFNATSERISAQEKAVTALVVAGQPLDEQIPQLGKTLRQLIEELLVLKKALPAEELKTALADIAEMEALLGTQFDSTAATMSAYETAIQSLMAAHQPLDEIIPSLGMSLRQLSAEFVTLQTASALAAVQQEAVVAAILKMQEASSMGVDIMQAYNNAVAELQIAQVMGKITWDQYVEAMARAKAVMEDAKTKAEDVGLAIEQGLVDLAGRAVDSFIDNMLAAGQSLGEFVRQALIDLTKLILKLELLKLLEGAGLGIPGLRHGGFLAEGRVALVGEAGPELVTAGHGGVTVSPMPPASAGGGSDGLGGITVPINLTVAAMDSRDVSRFFQENEAVVATAVTRAVQKSVALRRTLSR